MIRRRLAVSAAVAGLASLLVSGTPRGALAQAQPAPAAASAALSGINFDIDMLAAAPAGSWAEYTMGKPGSDKSVSIRYTLVEKTPAKLGLEIDTPTPQGHVLMRFDFASQPDSWKLVGSRMQRGDEKMEMPREQLDATPPVKKGAPPGELIGPETVTVAAGTFACRHYRNRMTDDPKGPVMDMWLSDRAPPTGLVKSALSPIGVEMVLGARSGGAQPKTK